MKAREILHHFNSQATWVDRHPTVDRILLGDPDRDVRTVLVTWMSTMKAIRYAVENGFDLLMTHEPTFWIHDNEVEKLDAKEESAAKLATAALKRRLVEESGLVVERNHDCWDRYPDIGIPWALAQHLGMKGLPFATGNRGFQLAYEIGPTRADELAERIAARTVALGDPYVQRFGDGRKIVRRLGIGTGCACRPDVFLEMGCDAAVVCDDGCRYWSDVSWAVDSGMPLFRVGHGTSEEPGMVSLTKYINDSLPGLKAQHFKLDLAVDYVDGRST